jgi:hypothetical protein
MTITASRGQSRRVRVDRRLCQRHVERHESFQRLQMTSFAVTETLGELQRRRHARRSAGEIASSALLQPEQRPGERKALVGFDRPSQQFNGTILLCQGQIERRRVGVERLIRARRDRQPIPILAHARILPGLVTYRVWSVRLTHSRRAAVMS